MLTKEQNELLARTGPNTPMGAVLRRYWHPVGCSEFVTAKPHRVKALGEELLLFRGANGAVSLTQLRCAHRSVALDYGRVEGNCIRCPYHGWLYDQSGQCVEQPAESEGSNFKDKVHLTSYRVQEMGGLVFAYMGPEPAPLLPLYDVLIKTDGVKEVQQQVIHANWLNHVENIVDISHLGWLHGYTFPAYGGRKVTYHWDRKDYGCDNVMLIDGIDDSHVSCYGYPTVNRFALPAVDPNGELVLSLIYRVPIDDESLMLYFLRFYPHETTRTIRSSNRPVKLHEYAPLAGDWWGIDIIDQDRMVIEQQGVIADREHERLGVSDGGIILMRQMMKESLDLVEQGKDPLCIIRDADKQVINFPQKSSMMEQAREDVDYSIGGAELNDQPFARR